MDGVGSKGRVVGLDINSTMLDLAQRLVPELHWIEGNAVALPFSDEGFDAVVCQQAFHSFQISPMRNHKSLV